MQCAAACAIKIGKSLTMDVVKTLCPPVRRKRKSRVVELLILINVHVGLAALFGPDGRPLNATTFAVTTENPSSSQSMIGNTSDLDDATATIIPTAPTFRSETVADSVHGNATTFELSSSVTGQTTAAAATEFIDYGRSNLTTGVVSASTLHTVNSTKPFISSPLLFCVNFSG